MCKRRGALLNILSSVLLCLTFGRLLVVLYGAGFAAQSTTSPAGNNRVPAWLPPPQQQPNKDRHPLTQQHDYQHRPATSQRTAAYDAGRRGEAMPPELERLSNNLRATGLGDVRAFDGDSLRSIPGPDRRGSRSSSSRGGVVGSGDASSATPAWGQGIRVLVFTTDSIQDAVARRNGGGPAEEIVFRESLAYTLTDAGAQVWCTNSPRVLKY